MRIGLLASVGATIDAFFPQIIQHWQHKGHRVFTAASTASRIGEFRMIKGLTRNPSIRNRIVPNELSRWVLENGLDVVLTNTATASALARWKPMPAPVAYFCHGLHWNTGKTTIDKIWRAVERWLIRNTAAVVTINSDDEKWFRKHLDEGRVLRLRHGVGVPLDKYEWIPAIKAKPYSLLWAGEFSQRKRPWLAVELMSRLKKLCPNATLTMIGGGDLRAATLERIVELGLEDGICIPGPQPFREVMPWHAALLHTAAWEGLPRVCLEAAVMGRRTFAFDVKGVRDVPHAYLAPDGDLENLVEALEMSLNPSRAGCQIDEVHRADLDVLNVATRLEKFLYDLIQACGAHYSAKTHLQPCP